MCPLVGANWDLEESEQPVFVARTLADSGLTIEDLFDTLRAGSLVDASEAGILIGASETETLPFGTTPSGCCCRERLAPQMTLLGTALWCA